MLETSFIAGIDSLFRSKKTLKSLPMTTCSILALYSKNSLLSSVLGSPLIEWIIEQALNVV